MSQNIFFLSFNIAKVVILKKNTHKWVGEVFGPPFRHEFMTHLNFGFFFVNNAVCNACVRFLCLMFYKKGNFKNPLPDSLITLITIIEVDLFCGGNYRKRKYADFRFSLTRCRYLLNRGALLFHILLGPYP